MIRHPLVLLFCLLLTACDSASDPASTAGPGASAGEERKLGPLIDTVGTFLPGKSLGNITIGENAVSAFQGLDSLTYTKEAPGGSINVYVIDDNGTPARLDVMTVPDSNSMNARRVLLVRSTAAKYKDDQGRGVGSSMRELQQAYTLRPVATFSQGGRVTSLHGSEQGVLFEFKSDSICHALVIAPAGANSEELYRALFNNYTPLGPQ